MTNWCCCATASSSRPEPRHSCKRVPVTPRHGRGVPRARRSSRTDAVNGRITIATARRVLRQLRHDPRTVLLILAVPSALLVVLRYVFDGEPATFQRAGVPLMGIFPFISMFLVTWIALLRERVSGTLERLMTMPLSKADTPLRLWDRLRGGRGGPGLRHRRGRRRAARPRRRGLVGTRPAPCSAQRGVG